MAMDKKERQELKQYYTQSLLQLVEDDPNNSFLVGLREYRRRLNSKQEDAFKTVDEAANFLADLQSKDPWWTSFTAEERRRRLQEVDPEKQANFNDSVESARGVLESNARNVYGFDVDAQVLDDMARRSYLEGWDENDIRTELKKLADESLAASETNDGYRGQIGKYAAELSAWSAQNGFEIDQQAADQFLSSVSFGEMTIDQVKDSLRKQYMVGAFPAWAEQINAGMDIYQLASPYRAVAQRMLGRTEVTMNDPMMQQMMQVQDESGSWKARPLWEAEKFIRGTDEWQYSDDAYETYASVGERIGKMFGFG